MADFGNLRFEYICEAIAPDGTRTRIGVYAIPAACLLCGEYPAADDPATSTTSMDGTSMATVNNRTGLLCAPCTAAERARVRRG